MALEKEPWDSEVFRMEFHDRLLPGETITTIAGVASERMSSKPGPRQEEGALTLSGEVIVDSARAVDLRIAGGRDGDVHKIEVRVTTSLSLNQKEGTGLLEIRD